LEVKNAKGSLDDKKYFDLGLKHKYLYFRRTKIVATIGPSSSSPETLKQLILKGLNVARINFSHGKPGDHLHTIQSIRKISAQLGMPVAVLGDLCGPKIRVGRFQNDAVLLKDKTLVTITVEPVLGHETLIPCQYKKLVTEVKINDHILLDDGNLELLVIAKARGLVQARVVRGGVLRSNKEGVEPGAQRGLPAYGARHRGQEG
jgi:pyruvate kinase